MARKKSNRFPQIGQRFGSWTVLGEVFWLHVLDRPRQRKAHVVCECDCGTVRVVECQTLWKGRSKSCRTKHDYLQFGSKHPLQPIWNAMRNRCCNSKTKSYPYYGGRGITICEEWRTTSTAFIAWAIANGWRPGLEIDRKDNNGNYEPGNCQFSTRTANMRNRSNTRLLTAFGETKSAPEWAEDSRCLVDYGTLIARIDVSGWTCEAAIVTPSRRNIA